MYTSYIGKKFLTYYNQRKKTQYTAEAFFLEIFFDLFFKDDGHLMHVANSPFHTAPDKSAVALHGSKSLAQLEGLKERINRNRVYMGTYVGGSAEDIEATTSGQLTNMNYTVDKEDMYASWIGAALGIGVKGGYVMLLDKEEILWSLYEGWEHYRKYLNQRDELKDRQIETWNGNWLRYGLQTPWEIKPVKMMEKWSIPTQPWVRITFILARQFRQLDSLVLYAYNLSQTNTTLGFISLVPSEVNRLFEWRGNIFLGEDPGITADQVEMLETYYDFRAACKLGAIGLEALEPKALREYMPKPFGGWKEFIYSTTTDYHFKIFKLWLITMLNRLELLTLADEMAATMKELEKSEKKGRTIKDQLNSKIMESKSVPQFIDKLTEMLAYLPDDHEMLHNVMREALIMPVDHLPLFLSLVRFQYAYRTSKN